MTKTYRLGAIGALLDEYERAITDLQRTITDISDDELVTVVDHETEDPDCKSIQTVLAHVVKSGFGYAINIRQLTGEKIAYPDKVFRLTVTDFQHDLNNVFRFTLETLSNIQENQLEQLDNTKKILTSQGQIYDIEQMTEHAIVHILRHRRQIEKFKFALRERA